MLARNTILQSRYRIVRKLGEGGMGTIYEAIDERLNSMVAIKETIIEDEEMRKAFGREASLLANLRHSSLPKVIDHYTEANGQFLVMEFISGHDLAQLLEIRGHAFAPHEVLQWADEILKALEYLHSHKPPVIHRDIKPSNLKLTERGELFLLDFGLAKGAAGQMQTLHTNRSVRAFTPVYASLEQIHGVGTEPRSDLYSLGVTLYHLITGVMPIDAPTRFTAEEDGQPDPLRPANEVNPEVSAAVAEVLKKAVAISRNQRFATAREMREALREAGSFQPTTDNRVSKKAEALPAIAVEAPVVKNPKPPNPTEASPAAESSETAASASPLESATLSLPSKAQILRPQPVSGEQKADAIPRTIASPTQKSSTPDISALRTPEQQTGAVRTITASLESPRTFTQPHPTVRKKLGLSPGRATRIAILIGGASIMVLILFASYVLISSIFLSGTENQNSIVPIPSAIGREGRIVQIDVNLRRGPSIDNDPIGVAEVGSRVRVLSVSSNSNWYEVEVLEHGREKEDPNSADRGWITKKYLKLDEQSTPVSNDTNNQPLTSSSPISGGETNSTRSSSANSSNVSESGRDDEAGNMNDDRQGKPTQSANLNRNANVAKTKPSSAKSNAAASNKNKELERVREIFEGRH